MFGSFRTRLIVFFAGLLVLAMASSFLAVHRASVANARRVIAADLAQDAAVFRRLLDERSQHLLEAARLLASDFAFKEAYAVADRETLLSVMENHLGRMPGGDRMLVLALDGAVVVDTAAPAAGAEPGDPWAPLVAAAAADPYGEAAALVGLGDRLFQMMVVPLLAPDLRAWILIGFEIDGTYAHDLQELILSEVAILGLGGEAVDGSHWIAGTLPAAQRAALPRWIAAGGLAAGGAEIADLKGEPYVSSAIEMPTAGGGAARIVLQRPLADELTPFERLRTALLIVFCVSVAASIVAAVAVARSVTRPVLELAGRARRIVGGDYSLRQETHRRDEIGTLGRSFDHMVRGLAEKERVRDLLGKVMSPAIAEELMESGVELGGEEREVTVLFSDLRNFTDLCEKRDPREILSLLNLYLTEVGGIIESHGGVVDKYMGDAVMALFGAPLARGDDAARAVATGLDMIACVERLNRQLADRGLPQVESGVGIHTGRVVAGNMGSPTRLNYTVIGDGVNLAARLEGLTKRYRVPLLVSEATRQQASGFRYRRLDCVRVRGRREATTIFQPLGRAPHGNGARHVGRRSGPREREQIMCRQETGLGRRRS